MTRALVLSRAGSGCCARPRCCRFWDAGKKSCKALDVLQELRDVPPFESAFAWGKYYESISEYGRAGRHVTQALELALAGHNLEAQARCYARLGIIAWRQGDYEEAAQYYNSALPILQDEERFTDEEAEVRYGLGLVYRQLGPARPGPGTARARSAPKSAHAQSPE